MFHHEAVSNLSTVVDASKQVRLRELTDETESGKWEEVITDVTRQILANPDWLLDNRHYPEYLLRQNRNLLIALSANLPYRLDDISGPSESLYAFMIRFMEVFSQMYGFKYVWRGGSMSDVDEHCWGSYTFSVSEAKERIVFDFTGARRSLPCLIGLPVTAIIEYYRQHPSSRPLLAEHGWDGIYTASFELNLPVAPPKDSLLFRVS